MSCTDTGKKFGRLIRYYAPAKPESSKKPYLCSPIQRGVRVVEGARLESVYSPKGYRGFESHPLCKKPVSSLGTGFLLS